MVTAEWMILTLSGMKTKNACDERVQRQNVSKRVLSNRWVDKPHRSRYTVRGYEQELTGSEDFMLPLLCGPTILHRWNHQNTSCTVECWDDSFQSETVSDMQALRKLARYIKGTLPYKLNIRPRHNTDLKIEAHTDADWAGQSDRHSITGGLLVLDGVNVSSWARTQKAVGCHEKYGTHRRAGIQMRQKREGQYLPLVHRMKWLKSLLPCHITKQSRLLKHLQQPWQLWQDKDEERCVQAH